MMYLLEIWEKYLPAVNLSKSDILPYISILWAACFAWLSHEIPAKRTALKKLKLSVSEIIWVTFC